MSRFTNDSSSCFGCIVMMAIFGLLFCMPTEYTFEYWLPHFKGEPVDIPFWAVIIASPFIGEFGLLGGIITYFCDIIDIPPNCPYIPN